MLLSADQRQRRRARFPNGVFARELAQLDIGELPSRVLRALCKGRDRDAQWGLDLKESIEHVIIGTGEIRDTRVRRLDSEEGRRLLRFFLLMLGLLQRGKGPRADELRVDGPDGYWGRTEVPTRRKSTGRPTGGRGAASDEDAAELEERYDALVAQARAALEEEAEPSEQELNALFEGEGSPRAGAARPYKQRAKLPRKYCPSAIAGGLAGRLKVSTRTIGHWARFARASGFLGCRQPDRDHEDAYLSRRQGDYAYGIWRLLRALPAKMMFRLQLFWGELELRSGARHSKFARQLQAADALQQRGQSARGRGRPADKPPPSELEREKRRGARAAHELVPGRF